MPPSRAEAILRDRLARGPLPFAAFMEEALYGEGGYYRREELPIGEEGDYVTGSSFSPLFGRATGRLLRRLDSVFGRPADFLEAGYGAGVHLAAVLSFLGESGDDGESGAGTGAGGVEARRVLAWDRVERPVPPGASRLAGLAEVPERGIEGLIFSYELFDALPVHRLIGRPDGTLGELWVALDEAGEFAWREGELSEPGLADLLREPGLAAGLGPASELASGQIPPSAPRGATFTPGNAAPLALDQVAPGQAAPLAPGQVADLAPGWAPLYRDLAKRLGRGLLVTCDYGFERGKLLDPRARPHGTLAAYTRQRVHRNPFVRVGEQDLTAHVDFTALRAAGEAEGLATLVFTRQALWLMACGLFADLQEADADTRQQAMALLDGEGMGQEIRVLVQGRGVALEDVLNAEGRAALGV